MKPSKSDTVLLQLINKAIKQQNHINDRLSQTESVIEELNTKNPKEKNELNLMFHFPLTIKNIELFEEKLKKEKYATALVIFYLKYSASLT